MLVFVFLLIIGGVVATTDIWWTNALIYQIYPVSFKDSDGDGYGDLKGITEKVAYLKSMGVTAAWLSPIYKSPNYDWGYDISGFREIDPLYGTMDDFEELMLELKRQGMYLIMDFVPNHTSDHHPWFLQSVRREEPYTDFYVWQDARGVDDKGKPIPPNNWVDRPSIGSCWEWNDERRQFYLHQYLVQQPDLNFRNQRVAEEITEVLKFWLDKGVDGFRIDSVPFLFEDKDIRDEIVTDTEGNRLLWMDIDHIYTQNLNETYNYMLEWGKIFEEYIRKDGRKRVMFLEIYNDLNRTMSYFMGPRVDGDPQFMIPFNFEFIQKINRTSQAPDYKRVIDDWLSHLPEGAVSSWVLGNHDNSRVATRLGPDFSDALNMIVSILPGVRFFYNGEELAMEDTFVTFQEARDNFGKFSGPARYLQEGRDPERTPLQWDHSVSAGFTNNSRPWLPVNPNFWHVNVAAQQKAGRSHLKIIEDLARVRSTPTLKLGSTMVQAWDLSTLVITRNLAEHDSYILVVNTGSYPTTVGMSQVGVGLVVSAHIAIATLNFDLLKGEQNLRLKCSLRLRPKAAVLLRVRQFAA